MRPMMSRACPDTRPRRPCRWPRWSTASRPAPGRSPSAPQDPGSWIRETSAQTTSTARQKEPGSATKAARKPVESANPARPRTERYGAAQTTVPKTSGIAKKPIRRTATTRSSGTTTRASEETQGGTAATDLPGGTVSLRAPGWGGDRLPPVLRVLRHRSHRLHRADGTAALRPQIPQPLRQSGDHAALGLQLHGAQRHARDHPRRAQRPVARHAQAERANRRRHLEAHVVGRRDKEWEAARGGARR